MYAEILIKNGRCITMKGEEFIEWIAISDGKILDLGIGNEFKDYIGIDTIIFDAKKNTVLPGFIDSHFHMVQTALNSISLDLSGTKNHEEIGRLISEEAKANPGKHIRGIRLDAEKLEEKCFPGRNFLDKFCNDVPVWINSSEYQVSVLNTYAMLYFKIPFTTEGIELDEKLMPTGIFRRQANSILRTNILKTISNSERKEAVSGIMEQLLSNGITTVNAMEGGCLYSDKDADFIYENRNSFPVDIELFYQTMDLNKIRSMKLTRVGGCLYIDGTLGARTAALSFEYADCPGTMGSLCLTQQEVDDLVLNCYKHNFQLALYTIGDRAIEAALKAHEKAVFQTGNIGLRHRLEHVELPSAKQIQRAKKLGIVFSMQPTYELYWGGIGKMYNQRLGEQYEITNPFREIIDNGICICGGTDSDVTEPNPIIGIHAAVNHPVEKHSVSIKEALKMFTCNGAYAIGKEKEKGRLAKGMIADVIILDKDITKIEKERIRDIKVSVTIKSGEILFNNWG